jgi:protein involved in ribonucleotide reduction
VEQDLKDILYQIANENGYSIDHMEVGFGNKNFNHQYCLTAEQYSKKF